MGYANNFQVKSDCLKVDLTAGIWRRPILARRNAVFLALEEEMPFDEKGCL